MEIGSTRVFTVQSKMLKQKGQRCPLFGTPSKRVFINEQFPDNFKHVDTGK